MSAPLADLAAADVAVQSAQATVATGAKAMQMAIRARLMHDVARLWPALDAKRLTETWPGWLRAMTLLTKSYHAQSATAAGASYRAARQHATQSPAPRSLIRIAPAPADDWLTKAFGYSGPGMLGKDTARPGTALSTTLGTASRIVLSGGRTTIIDTVHDDPVAVGWYRLTDGSPCAFCALMASRGIVYKSEKTADFQAHNDCGCSAAPAFSRSHELPDINRTALQVYRAATHGVKSGEQMAAFRKAWAEHQGASAS